VEINPVLVELARKKIRVRNLEGSAEIVWKDMWKIDLGDFDVLTVFGTFHVMPALAKKIKREMKPGSKIVSVAFKFGQLKPVQEVTGTYMYEV